MTGCVASAFRFPSCQVAPFAFDASSFLSSSRDSKRELGRERETRYRASLETKRAPVAIPERSKQPSTG